MSTEVTEVEKLTLSLQEYEQQLQVVQEALTQAVDPQKTELLDLQQKLEEVIQLTKDGLNALIQTSELESRAHHTTTTSTNARDTTADLDAEFLRFQAEMASLGGNGLSSATENNEASSSKDCSNEEHLEMDEELYKIISSLPGQKCQAPFQQEWGELLYLNAVILSADIDEEENTQIIDSVKVRVMFMNPICEKMKPCPFFLDDTCKFSEEKCRYSHGHEVALGDIREYVKPDFSCLGRDSVCLAKYEDGIWYKAVIEDVLEESKFTVKFTDYGNTEVVSAEDVFPLGIGNSSEDSSSDSDSDSALDSAIGDTAWQDEAPLYKQVVQLSENSSISALGEWEKHTTGIGSKLMAKMGYIFGQGLGKNGEGRTEPVGAVVLPQGKSLDKCIELRERNQLRDPFKVKKKQQQQLKKKEAAVASGYHSAQRTVFDFLNKKISFPKAKHQKVPGNQKPFENVTQDFRNSSDRGLNVQSLQLTQNIRRAEHEINRLQQAASRNKDKDKVVHAQLQQKISVQQQLLKNLQLQEKVIQREQHSRKMKQKLVVF